MELSYVLRRAWEIMWRHKALWLFGLLVSLGTVGTRVGTGSSGRWEWMARELSPQAQRAIANFRASPHSVMATVALALLALIVAVGLALLSALGRAALVDQVRAAEELGAVDLRTGWQTGRRYLWSVFLIRLLIGLPVAIVTLGGVLPVVGTSLLLGGQQRPEVMVPGAFLILLPLLACLLPTICLAVLMSIPLGVLQRLAVRACVLEGCGVGRSIVRAWAMLRAHLGPLALVWLVRLGLGIGLLVVIGLPFALVAMSLVAAASLTVFTSPTLPIALMLIIGLVMWLVGTALNGVVVTFTSAVWTLAYRELTGLGLTGEQQTPAVRSVLQREFAND